MAALVCDICGGKLVMGTGGIAICDSCGMEHSADRMKEKIQEIKGTVRVDNTHMVSTYLEMIATALEAGNNEEAENYANKVIEIDPRSAKAWLYKGTAAGWQTTGRNNRFSESIVNWSNAYHYASENEKDEIKEQIKTEARNIGAAILQMECSSFVNFRSNDNKEDIINSLSMIQEQLGLLKEKTEIDVYTDGLKTILARAINTSVVDASTASDKEFGPKDSDRSEYSWHQFTAAQDRCLVLLDKAYDLCFNENLCYTICKNYISIAEEVRDSCSYRFEASAYSDGVYVRDYFFTPSAKNIRTEAINEWKEKRDRHDPDKREENCKTAMALYASSCNEAGKKLAIAQYWESHASERASLEDELREIEAKKSQLEVEASNNSDKNKIEEIDREIESVRNRINSLGLFKGKEKKALSAQLEELTVSKRAYEERWESVKKQLDAENNSLSNRSAEISREFTKDRGMAKITPKQYLTVFENGMGMVSALDLAAYYKSVLPGGFTVKGEGNEAIENYTKTLNIQLSQTLSLLLGEEKAMSYCYDDKLEGIKDYRINFQVNGKDSYISANFSSKTIDTCIGDNLSYELDEDKSPHAVANFIQIVVSSIVGICPSIELNGLEEKIAQVAYGIVPETTIKTDNLICTITGGIKNLLKFVIKPDQAKM